jgi:hypothetical protein
MMDIWIKAILREGGFYLREKKRVGFLVFLKRMWFRR